MLYCTVLCSAGVTHHCIVQFMESYKSSSKQKYGLYSQETFLPFNAPERKLLKRQEKRGPTKDMTLVRTVVMLY